MYQLFDITYSEGGKLIKNAFKSEAEAIDYARSYGVIGRRYDAREEKTDNGIRFTLTNRGAINFVLH